MQRKSRMPTYREVIYDGKNNTNTKLKPNILFLLLDSFRADKCYGNNKTSMTPNIDSLIKNGVYFNQAISSAPSTNAGVSSIFTGEYPFKAIIRNRNCYTLNPKTINYINILKDYGYHAYAIVRELFTLTGLTRDFGNNVEAYYNDSVLYDGLGQKIIEKLKSSNTKEPWFYYIHLMDLHKPEIGVPEEFNDEKYGSNQYERMLSVMDVWIGKILQSINLNNTLVVLTGDHGSDDADYTSSVEKNKKDALNFKPGLMFKLGRKIVGRFPAFLLPFRTMLREMYLMERQKIMMRRKQKALAKIKNLNITASEKRILLNAIDPDSHVYDERLRIPLIFAGYEVTSNSIMPQQVRTIDIFPTIAEIIGLPGKKENLDGISLLPLLQGKKIEEVPAYVQSAVNWSEIKNSNVIGIRTSEYKYFRDANNPKKNIHLYNLKNDPLEENNIAQMKQEIVEEMERKLTEIRKNSLPQGEQEELTEAIQIKKIEEELRKLGYINNDMKRKLKLKS